MCCLMFEQHDIIEGIKKLSERQRDKMTERNRLDSQVMLFGSETKFTTGHLDRMVL